MKAKKGDWFSLNWDLSDYANPICFEQYDSCPRFIYSEEDSGQVESLVINKFDRIRLTGIMLTEVFITDKNGVKFPTHYKPNEFMPGDRPSYDEWLKKYHRINFYIAERVKDKERINQKNIYLDYTSKILRHDMHSGINTYIPRGIKGILKRLPEDVIEKHSLSSSIKMLEEGIAHTQKVYSGVLAFTNLVREESCLKREDVNLKDAIEESLSRTAYGSLVEINLSDEFFVDRTLFSIAILNLIKGGLKFNQSEDKFVKIYSIDKSIFVQDNGVGLSKEDFSEYCRPFLSDGKSSYTGLDLNIAVSIIESHGFSIEPVNSAEGTLFEINTNPKKDIFINSLEIK